MNSITSALTDSNSNRQKELFLYFQNLEQNSDGWKLAINELTNNQNNLDESAIFFYLKLIECYVKNRFETDIEENKFIVKQYCFNYFVSKNYDARCFILNKFASIVNSLFLIDYPLGKWNSFFHDFLLQCNTSKSCDLFLRILDQINTDIGERDYAIAIKNLEKANFIKDLMRQSAVNDITQFWFMIIDTYKVTDPNLVCFCLTVIGKYISWIDINLVTNDTRMSILLNLLYNTQIRSSVLDCFFGILHKGMDTISKATFIEQFCQVPCVNELFLNSENESDELFVIQLAKFFNMLGLELVECFKKLKPKNSSSQENDLKLNSLFVAIDNKFAILCKFLSNNSRLVSIEIHPFAREYIQLLKSLSKKNDLYNITDTKIQEVIVTINNIIKKNCKYSSDFKFSNDLYNNYFVENEEDEFDEFRKSCCVLLDNLILLNKDFYSELVLSTIVEPTLKNSDLRLIEFNELEIALFFLKSIGDNGDLKNNHKLIELIRGLVINSVIDYPHMSITIMYFELITKYEKIFSTTLVELLPQILISFLDKNGLKSPYVKLRCKVSNLFNRFIKNSLKNKNNQKIFEFSEHIIKSLEPIIKIDYYLSYKGNIFNEFNSNNEANVKANRENQMLLYESISILILHNESIEKQNKIILFKNIILDPIIENIEQSSILLCNTLNLSNSQINKSTIEKQLKNLSEDVAHLIELSVSSLKVFSNQTLITTIRVQNYYLEIFNQLSKLLSLNLNEDSLCVIQNSLCQLLHRLIVYLDENEIVPLMPIIIKSIFLPQSYFTVSTIKEIVSLINQFVTKFKNTSIFYNNLWPFLKEFFSPFIIYIFNLTNSGRLEDEDMANLQKTYYYFIWIMICNLPLILNETENHVFEQILITLVQGLEINDESIHKYCLQILKTLVENKEIISKKQLLDFIYSSAIPASITLLIKTRNSNQILNELIGFLAIVNQKTGNTELSESLIKLFTQQFPSHVHIAKSISKAFLRYDNNSAKMFLEQFHQQVKKKFEYFHL